MTYGILIYAHNNRTVDYALMAVISGGLAKKHLDQPVSLVTDQSTVDWMKGSKIYNRAKNVFDQIIIIEKPHTNNNRVLHDGLTSKVVPFTNVNRCSAWEHTPYTRTLLIDSDFLIFSDRLKEYWDVDQDLLIAESANDLCDISRLGYQDRYISDVGVKLNWATTVMFTKNENTQLFFNLVAYIKDNYQYFADTYRFDVKQYRNDIAFSIAKHILQGFQTSLHGLLPPILTLLDRDILHSVDENRLTVLVSSKLDSNYCLSVLKDIDIHVMNKQSIVRHSDRLLELI